MMAYQDLKCSVDSPFTWTGSYIRVDGRPISKLWKFTKSEGPSRGYAQSGTMQACGVFQYTDFGTPISLEQPF